MSTNHNSAATPILIALGLRALELQQLRSNGFVSCELRANGAVYKLRYRMDGQQRVRGLGGSLFAIEIFKAHNNLRVREKV